MPSLRKRVAAYEGKGWQRKGLARLKYSVLNYLLLHLEAHVVAREAADL